MLILGVPKCPAISEIIPVVWYMFVAHYSFRILAPRLYMSCHILSNLSGRACNARLEVN